MLDGMHQAFCERRKHMQTMLRGSTTHINARLRAQKNGLDDFVPLPNGQHHTDTQVRFIDTHSIEVQVIASRAAHRQQPSIYKVPYHTQGVCVELLCGFGHCDPAIFRNPYMFYMCDPYDGNTYLCTRLPIQREKMLMAKAARAWLAELRVDTVRKNADEFLAAHPTLNVDNPGLYSTMAEWRAPSRNLLETLNMIAGGYVPDTGTSENTSTTTTTTSTTTTTTTHTPTPTTAPKRSRTRRIATMHAVLQDGVSTNETSDQCLNGMGVGTETPLPVFEVRPRAPMTQEERLQPHRVVQRFYADELAIELPPWLVDPFMWLLRDGRLLDAPCYGEQHRYVWYPLDLTDTERTLGDRGVSYRVYSTLVSRIHRLEELLELHRHEAHLPSNVLHALLAMQDQHHLLALFMSDFGCYADVYILRPLDQLLCVLAAGSDTDQRALHKQLHESSMRWSRVRELYEQQQRSKKRKKKTNTPEPMPLHELMCPISAMHALMPSYDLVFHHGQLPELSLLVLHLGMHCSVNRESMPVQLTSDVIDLMDLLVKADSQPTKLRDMSKTVCEKILHSPLVFDCVLRMTMASFGGYYYHAQHTSFFTRHLLYRDLVWRQPSAEQLCSFLTGHYTLSATGAEVEQMRHNKLALHIVKEFLYDSTHSLSGMHRFMSTTFVGHEHVTRTTFAACNMARRARESAWFGHGHRYDYFQNMHDRYVGEWRSKCAKAPRRGQGTKTNGATSTPQKAKRRMVPQYPIHNANKLGAIMSTGEARHVQMVNGTNDPVVLACPATAYMRTPQMSSTTAATATSSTTKQSARTPPALASVASEPEFEGYRTSLMNHLRNYVRAAIRYLLDQLSPHIGDGSAMGTSSDHDMNSAGVPRQWTCALVRERNLVCRKATLSVEELLYDVWNGAHSPASSEPLLSITPQLLLATYVQTVGLEKCMSEVMAGDNTIYTVFEQRMAFARALLMHAHVDRPGRTTDTMPEHHWDELLASTCGSGVHVLRGFASDHRTVLRPLHARSLVHYVGMEQREPAQRCVCYLCKLVARRTMCPDQHTYREFQERFCGGALARISMAPCVLDLLEQLHDCVYKANLRYMYRMPFTSLINNLVHVMCMHSADNHDNEQLVRAAARMTETERRLISACVSRLDVWQPLGFEWLGVLLNIEREVLDCQANAEHMFMTRTYPVDINSFCRYLARAYPHVYVLYKQYYTEIYDRRMSDVRPLPVSWMLQQATTAHTRWNMVPHGGALPRKPFLRFYCPHHGDFKAKIARSRVSAIGSIGCTTAAGVDVETGCVYCTTGIQRERAQAQGKEHEQRMQLITDQLYLAQQLENELAAQENERKGGGDSDSNDVSAVFPHEAAIGDDDSAAVAVRNIVNSRCSSAAATAATTTNEHDVADDMQQTADDGASGTTGESRRWSGVVLDGLNATNTTLPVLSEESLLEKQRQDMRQRMQNELTRYAQAFGSVERGTGSGGGGSGADALSGTDAADARPAEKTGTTVTAELDQMDDADDVPLEGAEQMFVGDVCSLIRAVDNEDEECDECPTDIAVSDKNKKKHHTESTEDEDEDGDGDADANDDDDDDDNDNDEHGIEVEDDTSEVQENDVDHPQEPLETVDNAAPASSASATSQCHHRYKTNARMEQDERCNQPMQPVNMLGNALLLYTHTVLMCPMCTTAFVLTPRSFACGMPFPTCNLCVTKLMNEIPRQLSAFIGVACCMCPSTAALQDPDSMPGYVIVDNREFDYRSMVWASLCPEHNHRHTGDCAANFSWNGLHGLVSKRMRYVMRKESTFADGRPDFYAVDNMFYRPRHLSKMASIPVIPALDLRLQQAAARTARDDDAFFACE